MSSQPIMLYFPLLVWISLNPHLAMRAGDVSSSGNVPVKNIVVLGDSHVVGDFGEYLHRELHNLKNYNVTSVGIGGAGSVHFTMTMKNFCCGYKVRESCWFDSIPETEKIRVMEKSDGSTNVVVGKPFKGKLGNLLKHYEPDIVVVALGSNNTNAHEELVQMIWKDNPARKIIWVGPIRRANIEERLYPIDMVLRKHPDIDFVSCEDIIGHDTVTSAHYFGKPARNWAKKVVGRMQPFLY